MRRFTYIGAAVASKPANLAEPPDGASMQPRVCTVVVLPAPLETRPLTISPGFTTMSRPVAATVSRKVRISSQVFDHGLGGCWARTTPIRDFLANPAGRSTSAGFRIERKRCPAAGTESSASSRPSSGSPAPGPYKPHAEADPAPPLRSLRWAVLPV